MSASKPPGHLLERAARHLLESGSLEEASSILLQSFRTESDCGRPSKLQEERSDKVTIDKGALHRAGLVDWARARSRISEEFRLSQRQILTTAFGPTAEPGHSNLVLVTSARPGEGKSFVALNLAASIALHGDRRVLLVDVDSKPTSLSFSLGLRHCPGILDVIEDGSIDPACLIVGTPLERFDVLPIGRERRAAAEQLATRRIAQTVLALGRRYADHIIILDAPPCLSTSDPAILSQVVGQVLFIVEADRTQRAEIEASLDLVQSCPNLMLVLNKQQMSSRYTFGAYSSYYGAREE